MERLTDSLLLAFLVAVIAFAAGVAGRDLVLSIYPTADGGAAGFLTGQVVAFLALIAFRPR